jgi:hypothetical protein
MSTELSLDLALVREAPPRKPTVTFSTLAKAMGPTSLRALVRLLEGHKYDRAGPRRSYQNARRQAIELFADDVALRPGDELRRHEREAITAMARVPLPTPSRVRPIRPSVASSRWELAGVSISMLPDIEFHGLSESGAAKFVFNKTPLARGVGSMMAALLFHHRKNILGIASTRREQCVVYEPRLPWMHLPGSRPDAQIRLAERSCEVIAALWPSL